MQKKTIAAHAFRFLILGFLVGCQVPSPLQTQSSSTQVNLLPLASGRTWTYSITSMGFSSHCPTGTYQQRVLGVNAINGKTVYQLSGLCSGDSVQQLAITGDYVEQNYLNRWLPLLDTPLADGHTWTGVGGTFAYTQKQSISVKAGTFSDCWESHLQNTTVNNYAIYCRSVGMVASHSEDQAGNGWDAQLAAKNF